MWFRLQSVIRHRIATEKQKLIFEAFQQADAGTKSQVWRDGSGSGDIAGAGVVAGWGDPADEHAGQGSTFTLYLPLFYIEPVADKARATPVVAPIALPLAREEAIADDREHVQPGDQVLLVVRMIRITRGCCWAGAGEGVQGDCGLTGQCGAATGAAVSAHGHHAGYFPAGYVRVDGVE